MYSNIIYLLYCLKCALTTITLDEIIFYVLVANIGLFDILFLKSGQCSLSTNFSIKIALFLISMMNLNLGFPLCFYNGRTELCKAGLCILFPLYLLVPDDRCFPHCTWSFFFEVFQKNNFLISSSNGYFCTLLHFKTCYLLWCLHSCLIIQHINNDTSLIVWFIDVMLSHWRRILCVNTTNIIIVGIYLIPHMIISLFVLY